MDLKLVSELLEAEVLSGKELLDRDVCHVEGSDLMSEVLTFNSPGNLLLTGLANIQVVNTANISGLIGVVFVRGRTPSKEVVAKAELSELPLLLTSHTMFEASGILFKHGFKGLSAE